MLVHSPKIVTDGLIFYYDMNNTKKSWKGAPTTNLTDVSLQAIQGAPTCTYVSTEDGWKKYALNGTWSAGSYPYSLGVTGITFTGGVTYSTSCYIKTNVPQKFGSLFTGMNYVNQPMNNVGTSFSVAQPDGSLYVGRSGFQYTSSTSQTGYLISGTTDGTVFNSVSDFVYLKSGQIETGSFPTPYVASARSTTQAVLDLVGRTTVTPSLTYASDNTFSLSSASSNGITIPLTTAFNKTEGTIDMWIYPTSYNGGNGYFVNRDSAEANALDWLWIGPYSGTFYFRIGNTDCCSNDLSVGSWYTVVPLNTWKNICCTWKSSGSSTVYVNGELVGSRSISAIPNTNPTANGIIGLGHGNADSYFNGKIPSTKIYNRQLSSAEVMQNFNATRGRYSI